MFDIEIIDGEQVALVTPESTGARMLKAINQAMIMARLSSKSGTIPKLTRAQMAKACSPYITTSFDRQIKVLQDLGLLDSSYERVEREDDDDVGLSGLGYEMLYTFTDYGVAIAKRISAGEEEIEIPLYY